MNEISLYCPFPLLCAGGNKPNRLPLSDQKKSFTYLSWDSMPFVLKENEKVILSSVQQVPILSPLQNFRNAKARYGLPPFVTAIFQPSCSVKVYWPLVHVIDLQGPAFPLPPVPPAHMYGVLLLQSEAQKSSSFLAYAPKLPSQLVLLAHWHVPPPPPPGGGDGGAPSSLRRRRRRPLSGGEVVGGPQGVHFLHVFLHASLQKVPPLVHIFQFFSAVSHSDVGFVSLQFWSQTKCDLTENKSRSPAAMLSPSSVAA